MDEKAHLMPTQMAMDFTSTTADVGLSKLFNERLRIIHVATTTVTAAPSTSNGFEVEKARM
jgi:hypothetical protein